MKFKKITAALSAIAMSAGMLSAVPAANAADSDYNYAEALQKSMFFYEVQQSGVLPEWNEVSWKADSMVDENGVETDIVPGGWFDAGDHYKFTLTNAYSASVMSWGYIQYKDAIEKAGLGELYRNNIQWAIDFVMGCDMGDCVIGTIGDKSDHNIWCSAEVYLRKHNLNEGNWERPYDTIENASVEALSAACLAEGYIIFKDSDPKKAAEYLKHAKSLFELADKTRDCKDIGGMTSMYDTQSWVDDCMYAANWLYMATGDESYLKKIETDYIPNFPKEEQSSENKYTWGLCWDDTSQAAALLYAINTGKQEWINHVSHHLDYWIDGYGGKKINYTPDGLAWLFQWGSLRHATTTSWLALVASDTVFADNSTLVKKYKDWAKGQMDYAFGDNDLNMSYVLGMGEKNPTAIHHRTASGIHDDHWNDLGQESSSEGWQTEYAHTLYGALVGGPNMEGKYINEVGQYQYSEVAIDYNAGYTAALCALVDEYGGKPLADFPPTETPTWAEWEVAAVLNGSGNSYTEIKAWAMNHTAWPTRVEKNISYRYYFDVSEVLAAGLSVNDITIKSGSQQYQEGQQGYAEVSGPYLYDGDSTGNTYYAEIKFLDGRAIQPTGQSEHRDEVQFRISIPDAIDGKSTAGAWDPKNDWSYKGVEDATDLKKPDSLNDHITMYVNDVLVWGTEPDGTTPDLSQPSTKPVKPTTEPTTGSGTDKKLIGDANEDGSVDIADATAIIQHMGNPDEYALSEQGKINADIVNTGDGVTGADAVALQLIEAKKIRQSELPITMEQYNSLLSE
ncbi:MAG: glycoside hydrolase family 9 protein [Ruminococcus sp.]|nr:glycoside hydrolase family 9 protein [Ruminococcus sp.]